MSLMLRQAVLVLDCHSSKCDDQLLLDCCCRCDGIIRSNGPAPCMGLRLLGGKGRF